MRSLLSTVAVLVAAASPLLPASAGAAEKAAFSAPGKKVVQPKRQSEMAPAAKRSLGIGQAKALLGAVEVSPDGTLQRAPATDDEARTLLREMKAVGVDEGAIPEQVIGSDQRKRVQATTTAPFRAIVDIAVGCSGTLIGPHHVLTAGHCVFDTSDHTYYSDLDVSPAENGGKRPFGRVRWKKALVPAGYIDQGLSKFDFAVIVLRWDVGRQTGVLGYGERNLSRGSAVSVAGYPGDKPYGTMWRSTCNLISTSSSQLYYPCDTAPGDSGSPVLAGNGKTSFLVGVHTLAYSNGYNGGTRLNAAVTDTVRNWVKTR